MALRSPFLTLFCRQSSFYIDSDSEELRTTTPAVGTALVRVVSLSLAVALVLSMVSVAAGSSLAAGPSTTDFATSAQHPPDTTDTDGDGLSDAREGVYGTDATVADTDGDGLSDGAEVACTGVYPDADPLRQDIYVEVDSTANQTLSAETRDAIEETFATAPVSNPDGTDGIDIHIRANGSGLGASGPVDSDTEPGDDDDIHDYYEDHFDHRDTGYYYVVLTADVAYDGNATYVGVGEPGVAAMEPLASDQFMASLFMHELGHSFGLDPGMDGIDASRYNATEYDSVMNYNALYDQLDYSNGTDSVGRDEWSYVATDRYQPSGDCRDCASACPPA